jgi:hypothetical protein
LTEEAVMVKLYAEKSLNVSRAQPAIVGNTAIVGGSVVRTEAGNIEVDFGYTFKNPPHVVVTPHLEGLGPVGFVETKSTAELRALFSVVLMRQRITAWNGLRSAKRTLSRSI